MTKPSNNPFQSPSREWTEADQENARLAGDEFLAGILGAVALAVLSFSVLGVGLLCVAQIMAS